MSVVISPNPRRLQRLKHLVPARAPNVSSPLRFAGPRRSTGACGAWRAPCWSA